MRLGHSKARPPPTAPFDLALDSRAPQRPLKSHSSQYLRQAFIRSPSVADLYLTLWNLVRATMLLILQRFMEVCPRKLQYGGYNDSDLDGTVHETASILTQYTVPWFNEYNPEA